MSKTARKKARYAAQKAKQIETRARRIVFGWCIDCKLPTPATNGQRCKGHAEMNSLRTKLREATR